MNLGLIVKALMQRRALRKHDRWSREELRQYQENQARLLRDFAIERSSFYAELYRGRENAPFEGWPIVTKSMLMGSFDQAVTDPRLKLKEVEEHLKSVRGDELYLGRYRICATAGTTGRRGIFPCDQNEWAHILASYARTYEWAGVRADLLHWTTVAVVSSRNPLHQSARVGASAHGPWMPVLRLDALDPLSQSISRMNEFQPKNLIAYASMLDALAKEAFAGRLKIRPRVVISASEVLSDETRTLVQKAWGAVAYDAYAATETAGLASPCPEAGRSHLYEDLVITEVVDERNRPVPPGQVGSKILVTVLFSKTLPLIRYEMSDRLAVSDEACSCGRPYRVMSSIEGRAEDVLSMAGSNGKVVSVHPNAFHSVFEAFPLSGWQVVQEDVNRLRGLIIPTDGLKWSTEQERAATDKIAILLKEQGVVAPDVVIESVKSIPKTTMGKTRLVVSKRANREKEK